MISRLKYLNGESSKSNEKIQEQLFKTSSVANSQNEIMTLPDITTLKNEDFPGSSTNNLKIDISVVFNILTTE